MQHGEDTDLNNAQVRTFLDSTTVVAITRLAMVFVIPVMGWVGVAIINLKSDVAVLQSTVQAGTGDRYHGSDAVRDFALRDSQIIRNQSDISKLYTIAGSQSALTAGLVSQMADTQRRLDMLEESRVKR